MTRGTRVVVIADPLRGYGAVRDFEQDGRLLVQFEASDAVAEWEPPDDLVPFHAQELEYADRWEHVVVPTLTDREIAGLLNRESA